jgi:hypothetical protein
MASVAFFQGHEPGCGHKCQPDSGPQHPSVQRRRGVLESRAARKTGRGSASSPVQCIPPWHRHRVTDISLACRSVPVPRGACNQRLAFPRRRLELDPNRRLEPLHARTARWQQLRRLQASGMLPLGNFVQRCSPSEKTQTFAAFAWPQPRARHVAPSKAGGGGTAGRCVACTRLVLFVDLGLDRRPNRLLQHGRVDAELIEQRRLQAPRLQADGARGPERGAAPRP